MNKEEIYHKLMKSFESSKKFLDYIENEVKTGQFHKSFINATKDYKIIKCIQNKDKDE